MLKYLKCVDSDTRLSVNMYFLCFMLYISTVGLFFLHGPMACRSLQCCCYQLEVWNCFREIPSNQLWSLSKVEARLCGFHLQPLRPLASTSPSNPAVLQVSHGCNRAALFILKSSPSWGNPAVQPPVKLQTSIHGPPSIDLHPWTSSISCSSDSRASEIWNIFFDFLLFYFSSLHRQLLIEVPDNTFFFESTSRITSTCIWVHADTHSEYLKRSLHIIVLLWVLFFTANVELFEQQLSRFF